MKSTEHWLVHEHHQFEALLRLSRDAAEISDWWALGQYFSKLVDSMRYHMAQEEEVLFPAYDAKYEPTFMSTRELCDEHSKIIDSLRPLSDCIDKKSPEAALACLEEAERFMLEHHQKEEHLFLPFASHLLFEDRDELTEKLENFKLSDSSREW